MTGDDTGTTAAPTRETPTRRALLGAGATAGAGLLAGCTDSLVGTGGSGDPTASPTDSSYTVSMAPVGQVAFDAVPEDVMVYSLLYADMAVAFGHGDAVNSLGFDAAAGGNTLDAYYERLPGVSFEYEDLTQLNSGSGDIRVDQELLYELDSDLHLADPCLFRSFDGWGAADIEAIREQVGPWFGNVYSRNHGQPPEGCREGYEYYTLPELAGRVGAVFRESERAAALQSVREDLLATIEDGLPPEDERPTVGAVIFSQGTFYPSNINSTGFANAHVRPLGAVDAFDDVDYDTTYGYEGLLEIDPDVILHQFGIASYYDVGSIRETVANDEVGAELAAIRNDRFYPSGTPTQGPLMNLFQLEMTAKQLYPEQFGAWPGYEAGAPYPELPEGERLFDRERVASIVRGEP
ncbi:ABC transporter substrate-binding protein [Haloglomus litoreum]|uniref:ABC transporter substrate-binding protein n=1 Tax=Haloglomus litoreum TaxID=3034026 RepID=UPI0023E787FE|nr:ABC transporter substrate-binding protein [Haloglomus sp. DT116]